MLVTEWKLVVDYAEKELKALEGSKNAYPDKYAKAKTNLYRAKRFYAAALNKFILLECSGLENVIHFDLPE